MEQGLTTKDFPGSPGWRGVARQGVVEIVLYRCGPLLLPGGGLTEVGEGGGWFGGLLRIGRGAAAVPAGRTNCQHHLLIIC